MVELRWTQMSLFLMLMLHFTAVTGKHSFLTIRNGDEVTLPCENVTHNQDKCDSTTWIFGGSAMAVVLFEHGQIHDEAKLDRLSVTKSCSLVIEKVAVEDVGRYSCSNSDVHLSVVTMSEYRETDEMTFKCSVSTRGWCDHTVKWLYDGRDVDKDEDTKMSVSQSRCSVNLTFPSSHLERKLKPREPFQCEVTELLTGHVQQFPLSRESWSEETVWWRLIFVSAGLSALIISVVTVNIWTRMKGNKTKVDGNTKHNDEEEGAAVYENIEGPSASDELH